MTYQISNRTRGWALLAGTGLALCFAANPAFAQASADASVDSNTIIVTAQRRSEALEDVPMSVAVIPQETLSSVGVNSVRDLANVTTGFQVNNSGSYPQPAIRGVTTTNAGAYENNVALFVDGLYQTTPQILNMDLPNVQSIQILKGPQGTLYGRNATGGAILIDTIDPGRDWAGNIEAGYGRFDDKRARGYVAGPLSDRIGVSLAGTFRKTDGYYKKASRTTPGQFDGRTLGLEQESVRAKVKAELTDSFTATAGYNFTRANDPRGVFFTPIENVANSYTVPGRNTRPRGLGEVAGDAIVLDFKQHEGYLNLSLDTGIGTLRSITGYTAGNNETIYDSNGNYVPDLYIDSVVRDRTWQESVDYNINAIKNVDLIVGGNYYNIKTDYQPGRDNVVYLGPASYAPFTYPDPATTIVPLSDYRKSSHSGFFRTKKAWAVFADVTFHATDKLSINLGGRYSSETQDVSAVKDNYCTTTGGCLVGGAIVPIGGITSTPYTIATTARSSTYNKFTPRASIRYEIAPHTNIYASYSQGFRGGEWNSTLPNDNPALWRDAKQETINAYEIGLKSGGGRFHYDLSGFYYDYKNLQVSSVTFIGALTVVTLQNAPKAKIYGAEANFDYDITDNFKIRMGGTWLHARYGDGFIYTGTGVNPNQVGFNTNSNPLKTFINVASVAQDLSGLQMPRAPDFSGFVGFDFNIPNKDGGLRFAANLKYTTSYVVTDPSVWGGDPNYVAKHTANPSYTPDNTALLAGTPYVSFASKERARQAAYALVNASVTWTDPTNHYYVRAWGNNLTNITVKTHYRPSASTYIPVGEPVTYGGTVGFKF
ncbi:TonB-dependent receptor [Novosphingobium sp. G106]|uniref:TonB-dependent receptor n=1 Tax=Novosphingobium sp. G106 TaxID=2849500 RepID=UPI001C2D4630|nr:TonB-dependent receptor [Novosphingobium sp. G106]MBV1687808.1 TonB-dependent receptor [Novosphingobium sp. G106]